MLIVIGIRGCRKCREKLASYQIYENMTADSPVVLQALKRRVDRGDDAKLHKGRQMSKGVSCSRVSGGGDRPLHCTCTLY